MLRAVTDIHQEILGIGSDIGLGWSVVYNLGILSQLSSNLLWWLWHKFPIQNGTKELKQYRALLSGRNEGVCWIPPPYSLGNSASG